MKNNYFTRKEALERIKEILQKGYQGYYCNVLEEVFNYDYIIGHEAKEAIEDYGIYEAFDRIIKYKEEYGDNTVGEIDLFNPVDVATMLFYIICDNVVSDIETLDSNYSEYSSEEVSRGIIGEINKLLTD
ncbi:MAG: hypothetical protein ABF991_00080 [Liquorilactobacillus hordei]|uniref:hypothetical protein n=1 Tax=Liquorilactobacillus hordei TaxID=468911 RepID=UPI0039E98288